MAKKLLFFSFKGGVGVSTFCVRLGLALANMGERVLYVDGDSQSASGLSICGCDGLQVYTLADYEKCACRAKQVYVQHPTDRNFYVMPSLGCRDRNCAAKAISEVESLYDYVLCDSIAGDICDDAAVVTEPYTVSLRSADSALSYLKDKKFTSAALVVNKMNGGLVFDGEILTPQEISAYLHAKLRAVIPEDLSLCLGKIRKDTLKAFAYAAENFSGKSDKIHNVIKPYYGVNGYFKRKMRAQL